MKILHLYPNLMNLYGDYGNVAVLCKHLREQGFKVELEKKEIQDTINFMQYDFIYMGSGTERNQLVALRDLFRYRQYLNTCIGNGKVFLFTGNAMELFGKSIDDHEALGLIDFTVSTSDKRYTGDVIVRNEEVGEVVGFINRSTLISGGEDEKLFDYEFKAEDLIDNGYEGYRYRNLFGTHIIGPVLVKNPAFLKQIVRLLSGDRYKEISCELEEEAYQTTLSELKKRK